MADMRTSNWTTTVISNEPASWLSLIGAADDSAPIPLPVVGESLPLHASYTSQGLRMAFWEASDAGGPGYKDCRDAQGQPVLLRHEPAETEVGFARRKARAVYRNYCKTIIDRFNSFVFRLPVQRDGQDGDFVAWSADVDGSGSSLQDFMRAAMRRAQVFGRCYIGIDTTRPADLPDDASEAQALDAGARVILRCIDPRRVLNWRRVDGQLVEALIVYGAGERAVLWRPDIRVDITLDSHGKVASLSPVVHSWATLPVFELAPFNGASQIVDIAELNKDLFNLETLLREEIWGTTFSQYWAFGVRGEQLEDSIFGPNRIICLPNHESRVEVTGGKPEQADSIRRSIADDVTEIYRLAGLKAEDPLETNSPKSGVALRMEFDTVNAILAAIADAAERAENWLIRHYNGATASAVTPSNYADDFSVPDIEAELTRSLDALSSPYVAPTAKRLESQRLNGVLHPKASAQDREQMDTESAEMFSGEAIGEVADAT